MTPTKSGLYTIELKVAPDTVIQAHTHRDRRTAVVVSGLWYFGYGPKNDQALVTALPPGAYYTETDERVALRADGFRRRDRQHYGYGPIDTVYVKEEATICEHSPQRRLANAG